MKRSIWIGLGLLVTLSSCTQTIIVFKPSPLIHPMPILPTAENTGAGELQPDPRASDQWALAKVGLTSEADASQFLGNANVKVAVLSTGIDYNHEDLIGQVAINRKEITRKSTAEEPGVNGEDDDQDGYVDNVVGWDVVEGHGFAYDRHGAGTATAGIIAARKNNGLGVSGIMDRVTLYPIRYINDNGQTHPGLLSAALREAARVKPDVVFLQTAQIEIGGYSQDPGQISAELSMIRTGLDSLRKLGVPVVVGAGDSLGHFGSQELDKLLATYPNVIIVTATDSADQIPLLANTGFELVTTAAPGEDVLSTLPQNKYGKVHGTAVAAAHVTAAIALAKSELGPRFNVEQVRVALTSLQGGDPIDALLRANRGGNRLNIVKFLAEMKRRG